MHGMAQGSALKPSSTSSQPQDMRQRLTSLVNDHDDKMGECENYKQLNKHEFNKRFSEIIS